MSETKVISCDEALRLLAEHLDGELDGTRREEVDKHLARCRSCFSRAEFEQRLKARLGALRRQPVESPFEERIRALIGQFVVVPED
jgi:anti-sigma factor (TIGR02949 family)